MTEFTGAWSQAAVAEYLDDATIPLRLACTTPSGRLWMVSLWFLHRDGELRCATSSSADVVRYLRHDPGVAFEVSTNEPPYKGVRGNGEVVIEPDAEKTLLRELLDRYLEGTDSPLARGLLSDDREEVALRIDPGRVFSWDFTQRMRDVAE